MAVREIPDWVRYYLLAQGLVTTSLALALLLAPGLMVQVWPWTITQLLAQIYSAPFLSYGVMSLYLAYRHTWAEMRVAVTAILVFCAGVLIASLVHLSLFSTAKLSSWLWFAGFSTATAVLALLAARALIPFVQGIGAR